MNEALNRKIQFAIKLLRSIPLIDEPVEIAYSGGKDSDVILELAKLSGINFRAIYKSTTIDPPGTIQHALMKGAEIIKPKRSFFNLVETKGFPSRFSRFCCAELKEYPVLARAVVGIRRSESMKRNQLYREPEKCRIYRSGKKVLQYYPILEWTDDDIEEFITEREIECAPTYYDSNSGFHVERRLGCMGCPLASRNKRIAVYKEYPKLLLRSIAAMQIYYNNKSSISNTQRICGNNAWNYFYATLFCSNIEDYDEKINNSLFPEFVSPKEFMLEKFKLEKSAVETFERFVERHSKSNEHMEIR